MKKFNFYLQLFQIIGSLFVGLTIPLHQIDIYIFEKSDKITFLMISLIFLIQLYFSYLLHLRDFKMRYLLKLGLLIDFVLGLHLPLILALYFNESLILYAYLLSVRHIHSSRDLLDQFDQLNPLVYRLLPLLFTLPILVHIIACGWIKILGIELILDDFTTTYIKAIYWSFSTLTTVGYGDIVPKTNSQMLYASMTQLIGVGLFGYIFSNIASIIARRDAAREHHMNHLDQVETFMRLNDIPYSIRTRVRSYYQYMWKFKKGYLDNAIIETLPQKIQSEIYLHINQSIISKIPILQGADPDLIEELMHQVELRICVPGEKIFRSGDLSEAMYFIHKGSVKILDENKKPIALLVEGAFFGEMALITNRSRSKTAQAASFTELYLISKSTFDKACKRYPEFSSHIHQIVRQRNSPKNP